MIELYKDKFRFKLEKNPDVRSHLPDHLAKMCEAATHQPVNPHRQRLLTASTRVAKVDPKAQPKSASGKSKAKKAKGKGKDEETDEVEEKKKPKKKTPKATPKVSPASDMKSKAKDDYQNAKKSFFDAFLDTHYLLVDPLKCRTSSLANIIDHHKLFFFM